jgi:hypothetical protein
MVRLVMWPVRVMAQAVVPAPIAVAMGWPGSAVSPRPAARAGRR